MESLSSTLILMWFLWVFHLSLLSFISFLPSVVQQSPSLPGDMAAFPSGDHQHCFPLDEVDYMRNMGETSRSEPECIFNPDSWLPRNASRGFTDLLLLSYSAAADSLATSPAF